MNIMNIFKKKKASGNYQVLQDNYAPANLPTEGMGLENYVTSGYPMNDPAVIAGYYANAEAHLKGVLETCDHHSAGTECDHYIDAQVEHAYALHEAEVANHENQLTRILSAQEMRKTALQRRIEPLEEKADILKADIEPLEGLEPQFPIHIGRKVLSIGGPVTIAAMLVDALVNYSFLSGILLTNGALLIITVLCMSVASDGCMWGLAEMLNRKDEKFTTKPLFWTICGFLGGLFLLSVVASVMIRFGSMDVTYGTINADGEFVGKASYSLAEYGITLISAFVTTATGVLSFAFSLDKNAFKISIRDRKKGELAGCVAELAPLENELALLENAPDVREWDDEKRAAAEHQIEALRVGLKLHCRKLLTEQVNDADFTEEMAESGKAVLPKEATESADDITPAAVHLDKVS